MPRPSSQILALAKRGAEVRVRELVNEIKTITAAFPHLRDSFDPDELPLPFILAKGAGRVERASGTEHPHRRRRMSAAARKRMSEAQKKRWAARRKATAKP